MADTKNWFQIMVPWAINAGGTDQWFVALDGKGRLLQVEAGRTLIYISQKVAQDSAFPFNPGDELAIHIDQKAGRLVVEKVD